VVSLRGSGAEMSWQGWCGACYGLR
jgi:hypothetical protein